jgi:hypothetical protein
MREEEDMKKQQQQEQEWETRRQHIEWKTN